VKTDERNKHLKPITKIYALTSFVCIFLAATWATAADCYLSAPGCLDTTFGGGTGKVITNTDGNIPEAFDLDLARSIAIQGDGKIVVAGTTTLPGGSDKFVVLRYNSDGTLDTGFGNGGVVVTSFGNFHDNAYAVALQSDGQIVVAGSNMVSSTKSGSTLVFAVARYNGTNGSLDASFGSGGKTTISFGNKPQNQDAEARALAIQSDGKILVAGFAGGGALARLNSNGSLDTSFGSGGKVTNSAGDSTEGLAIQSDGKILFGGAISIHRNGNDFAIIRYNANGTVDSSFGNAGTATADFASSDDRISAIEIDANNNVVAIGSSATGGFVTRNFAVARFTPTGQLDYTFGNGGKITTDIFGNWDDSFAGTIQSGGKIVAAGFGYNGVQYYFTLVRYNTDGTLDTAFGSGGIVTTDFAGGQENYAYGVTTQPDGKILAAGSAATANPSDGMFVSLARYLP
jgi:uncharacterized delta-60 repeat protein